MRVNRAHNTLFNFTNQAREPDSIHHYLSDMKLWVTHSQFIVGVHQRWRRRHAGTRIMPTLIWRAAPALEPCEIAISAASSARVRQAVRLRRCQYLESPDMPSLRLIEHLEQHLQRIIYHHRTPCTTISSMARRCRPHHGIWLSKRLRIQSVETGFLCRMRYAYPAIRHQATTTFTAPRLLSISASSTTTRKRITSAPALSTITPASAPAYRKIARPAFCTSASVPRQSQPHAANTLKMSNCSSACKCVAQTVAA